MSTWMIYLKPITDRAVTPPDSDYEGYSTHKMFQEGTDECSHVTRLMGTAIDEPIPDHIPRELIRGGKGVTIGHLQVPMGTMIEALSIYQGALAEGYILNRRSYHHFVRFFKVFMAVKYFFALEAQTALFQPQPGLTYQLLVGPDSIREASTSPLLPVRQSWEGPNPITICDRSRLWECQRLDLIGDTPPLCALMTREGERLTNVFTMTRGSSTVDDCSVAVTRIMDSGAPTTTPFYPEGWSTQNFEWLNQPNCMTAINTSAPPPVTGTHAPTLTTIDPFGAPPDPQYPGHYYQSHPRTMENRDMPPPRVIPLKWDNTQNDVSCLPVAPALDTIPKYDAKVLNSTFAGAMSQPTNHPAPSCFPISKNLNMGGIALAGFPCNATCETVGGRIRVRYRQGIFVPKEAFTLTPEEKQEFITKAPQRVSQRDRFVRSGDKQKAKELVEAHIHNEVFREESFMHLLNARLPMGSKMPPLRFDRNQLNHDTVKNFVDIHALRYEHNKPIPQELRVYVTMLYSKFRERNNILMLATEFWNRVQYLKAMIILGEGPPIEWQPTGTRQVPDVCMDSWIRAHRDFTTLNETVGHTFPSWLVEKVQDYPVRAEDDVVKFDACCTLADEEWYLSHHNGYKWTSDMQRHIDGTQVTTDDEVQFVGEGQIQPQGEVDLTNQDSELANQVYSMTAPTPLVPFHPGYPRVYKGTRFTHIPINVEAIHQLAHVSGARVATLILDHIAKEGFPSDLETMYAAFTALPQLATATAERFCPPMPVEKRGTTTLLGKSRLTQSRTSENRVRCIIECLDLEAHRQLMTQFDQALTEAEQAHQPIEDMNPLTYLIANPTEAEHFRLLANPNQHYSQVTLDGQLVTHDQEGDPPPRPPAESTTTSRPRARRATITTGALVKTRKLRHHPLSFDEARWLYFQSATDPDTERTLRNRGITSGETMLRCRDRAFIEDLIEDFGVEAQDVDEPLSKRTRRGTLTSSRTRTTPTTYSELLTMIHNTPSSNLSTPIVTTARQMSNPFQSVLSSTSRPTSSTIHSTPSTTQDTAARQRWRSANTKIDNRPGARAAIRDKPHLNGLYKAAENVANNGNTFVLIEMLRQLDDFLVDQLGGPLLRL